VPYRGQTVYIMTTEKTAVMKEKSTNPAKVSFICAAELHIPGCRA